MDAPLITSVNGVAAGAGLSFVGLSDLVFSSNYASFVSAYSSAGLTPDGSSSYFLPRIIGSRRYLELVMTNRVLSANEALNWGLVNQIFDQKVLWEKTIEFAESLQMDLLCHLEELKKLVHNSFTSSLEGQMELETQMISKSAETFDAKEELKVILRERVKPNFRGE